MNTVAFITPLPTESLIIGHKASKLSETDLISGLRLGDQKTVEKLYDMYSGSLYGIIKRILKDEEISEDILQETFLRIWQRFSLYNPAKGRLFTWMSNLARNLALDKLKSKGYVNNCRNEKISDLQFTVDDQFNVRNNPETIGIKEMVRKLRPEHRCIIDLVYYQGYTHVEAAEELQIPVGTLKTRMRMAVNDLRMWFR
ncbi:MAG: sigma-70 family RNA polymerase sigma factor [Daejeonella sp.]